MCARARVWVRVCVNVCVCACERMCVCVCVTVWQCVWVSQCTCVCVFVSVSVSVSVFANFDLTAVLELTLHKSHMHDMHEWATQHDWVKKPKLNGCIWCIYWKTRLISNCTYTCTHTHTPHDTHTHTYAQSVPSPFPVVDVRTFQTLALWECALQDLLWHSVPRWWHIWGTEQGTCRLLLD